MNKLLLILRDVRKVNLSKLRAAVRAGVVHIQPHATAAVAAAYVLNQEPIIEFSGWLDESKQDATKLDSIFDLLSITKAVITAPLALILWEHGILDLEESVSHYLPGFAGEGKDKIRVRHLLSHSAGLSDIDLEFDHSDPLQAWRHMECSPLHYKPGEGCEYSDLSFRLLGRVIEVAGKAPLNELMHTYLTGPLGMNSTMFNPPKDFYPYIAGRGKSRGVTEDSQVRALGGIAGCDGAFSNVSDLIIFGKMLLSDGKLPNGRQLLSPKSIELMTTIQSSRSDSSNLIEDSTTYLLFGPKSFGWELPWMNHCHGGRNISPKSYGKAGGVGSFIWIDPERKLMALLLTNYCFPWPFTVESWNLLVSNLSPNIFFDKIIEALY